jgi:signal transduction histidine kinase
LASKVILSSAVTVVVGPGKRIHVRDGGPGLSQDALACLSQPFTRASHPSVDGAGLGLAIVSQIMAYHGGVLGTDPGRRELSLSWPESDTDAAAPLTDE